MSSVRGGKEETQQQQEAPFEEVEVLLSLSSLCSRAEENDHYKQETARSLQEQDDDDYRDRWEFLKSLPHRLIRDIAFVIASPDLLLDSNELPTVSVAILGGQIWKWNESKKWLKMLNMQHVIDWFGARKQRTRLGDHFAACIEYVLRFSPVLQVERLIVSQQVQEVKFYSSSCYQNNGINSETNTPEPISKLSERLDSSTNCTDLLEMNIVQMSEGDPVVPSMEEVADDFVVPIGRSCGNQKQKNKLFKEMGKLKSSKTVTRTIGEFDFLFQCARFNLDTPNPTTSGKQSTGGSYIGDFVNTIQGVPHLEFPHKAASEEEVHHWEASVKFLLYAGPWEAFGLETPNHATWKVKKLNDVVEESSLCAEYKTGAPPTENSMGNRSEIPPSGPNIVIAGYSILSECTWGGDAFLGCFLGPHVGETLCDRKTRMRYQLALSQNSLAASFLHRTYAIRDFPEQAQEEGFFSAGNGSRQEKCFVETENKSVLKIVPGALLKGYLFYEYELWQLLRVQRRAKRIYGPCDFCTRIMMDSSKKKQTIEVNTIAERVPVEQSSALPEINYGFQCSCFKCKMSRSNLNPEHWMGWWVRINEFVNFAETSACEKSRWYIVPKKEWLSPVIVNGSDMEGCANVMMLDKFLAIAGKVAEEAALSEIPRKRRFMVAEVCWEADFVDQVGYQGRFQGGNSSLHSRGAWIEVSRGFVVEETWPDSRVYRPHGYVPNWSPSLQQGIK